MSMFISPADISSSDSGSTSDESDHDESTDPMQPMVASQAPSENGDPSSLLLGDDIQEGYDSSVNGLLDADPDRHSNLMTAALLEFYCHTRAADLLNRQHGSHKRYTRDSPEVQFLGKKMYNFKSRFLSSHGVLTDGIHNDEWTSTRQYYRDNLDTLGLSALDGLGLEDPNYDNPPSLGAGGDLVVATAASRTVHTQSEKRNTNNVLGIQGLDPLDFRKAGFEKIRLDMRNFPGPALPPFGSSPVSFPLFKANPPPPNSHMSRYAMEFSEVRVLGRGSFGEVYHVKNHIDGQDYAVKKIPLSQRRLEQLQCGNENQLETIMKEIRTLARLEHANVVRYYGAWVEQTQFSTFPLAGQQGPAKLEYEQTQSEFQDYSIDDQNNADESFGIVFEHSEGGEHQPSVEDEPTRSQSDNETTEASSSSKGNLGRSLEDDDIESIPRNFSDPSHSQLSSFGASDADIFTDGLSHDPSKLQVQRGRRNENSVPTVILHIQMSLHPISLSSYLNPQQPGSRNSPMLPRRHCFHLVPSLRLMLNIMSGVDYLHLKGIVHRDLKPANIFLSSSENRSVEECSRCRNERIAIPCFCHPRIGDFGLVADISRFNESSPESPVGPVPSKINRVVGTEFYCPPCSPDKIGLLNDIGAGTGKQRIDYTVDETLDIYALGVILFELLYRINTKMERQMVLTDLTRGSQRPPLPGMCCERPFFPTDFAQKVDQGSVMLCNGQSVAESLRTCIKGMLELQPHKRWRCSDVRRCLQEILVAVQGT